VKNAKIVQLWVWPKFLTLISIADWSDKSEWYCRTVHCFQNIWFNKRTHPNEHQNGYWLSTKWVLASDQSSVTSWLVQPIKELSSAAGPCAGRGCALIRQLANWNALFKISARWWPVTTTFCLGQCRLITDVAMEAPSHRTWFVRSASAPRRSAEIYTVYVRRKFHCRVAGRSDASRPASAQACPSIRPVPPRVRSARSIASSVADIYRVYSYRYAIAAWNGTLSSGWQRETVDRGC